jgi:hypothetical protein
VTPEAKIRELCTRLLAAQSDEAANDTLLELRDAIHGHRETQRLVVAQEYPCQKDDMAAD